MMQWDHLPEGATNAVDAACQRKATSASLKSVRTSTLPRRIYDIKEVVIARADNRVYERPLVNANDFAPLTHFVS